VDTVLLITIDTLRADAVGAYGDAKAETPWMDRLAAGGVRFEDAHAHNVVTLPSHANILSGRYPFDHGVRDNAGFRFPEGTDTLATLLHAHGYRTGAFVSAFPLDARFGLARGFDVYDDAVAEGGARPAFLEAERPGTETVARARRWLDANDDRPRFCWVHLYEPHAPYEPGEPWAQRFRGDPYRGEVAAADAALGPLLEPVLSAADRGRTLVVLTADHGESLGEHGEATHGIFAYEATLRVPLLVYRSGALAPRVVSEPARHVDILPTVLEALGLPLPSGLPGRSLMPPALGVPAGNAPASYFEALSGHLDRGWARLYGVIHERRKYIALPLPEMYDLRADPREARNLVATEPQQAEDLRRRLEPLRAADRGAARGAVDREVRERLRSLGYVSGGAPTAGREDEDDDPKRLIALDAQMQEIVGLYRAGDLQAALRRCHELVDRRPGMKASLLYLAHLEREAGDLEAAIAALRRAVALDPGDPTPAALLGASLTQAGRAQQAVDLLEPLATRPEPDVEVLRTRGLALARVGRGPDALAAVDRARALDPGSPLLLLDRGTIHLMSRERAAARADFQAALDASPHLAAAHSALAVLAQEDGARDEAIGHWKQAIALDPRECRKLLAVTFGMAQAGRAAEARPYLELFVAVAPASSYAREIERVRSLLGHESG
jgi:arylsulfatase A-like enzyme/Tfp pilus assembly protein PilF